MFLFKNTTVFVGFTETLDIDRLNHVDSKYDQSGFETLLQHIEIEKINFIFNFFTLSSHCGGNQENPSYSVSNKL